MRASSCNEQGLKDGFRSGVAEELACMCGRCRLAILACTRLALGARSSPMWLCRFLHGQALVGLLLLAAIPVGGPPRAQSEVELEALHQRVMELYQAGKYGEALPLAQSVADTVKARRGQDHPDYGAALNNLAVVLKDANRPGEAEPLMRRALAIAEMSAGANDPSVVTPLGNLALLLKDTNRPVEAEPLMRRALAIAERSNGPDHPYVSTRLNDLAQ